MAGNNPPPNFLTTKFIFFLKLGGFKILEIVVASGKGGVGKTTISSSLVYYLFNERKINLVAVDADVDAPNLHIFFGDSKVIYRRRIRSSRKIKILTEKCSNCGLCVETCRFKALEYENHEIKLNIHLCEGCGACKLICPNKALDLQLIETGEILVRKTNYGFYIVTGELRVGEHNSGNMVNLARALSREYALKTNSELIVIDAPPGIGCPVISSITGTNYLLIIAEPTPFSQDNISRLIKVARHFNVKMGAVINKYDLSVEYTEKLIHWFKEQNIEVLSLIPYDEAVINALEHLKPVIEYSSNSEISNRLREIGDKVVSILGV